MEPHYETYCDSGECMACTACVEDQQHFEAEEARTTAWEAAQQWHTYGQ